ncbi:MAG: iron ABC transporter permease [Deltaproteobacteria bacterium]|nr:iron ABC transporter permease [Deltaproteobacteria bacterium]MBW1954630.1 iron ABC transporter permease [Deltaproteobacteria bacterium]MBW2040482.1 iron ABC transporter permease [Deltaproteobacteria bacterium]MBW2131350.1 iron ABC transporter permease [Deltaproteobacteria bacterium]
MTRGGNVLALVLWSIIVFFVIYPLSILIFESFKIVETGSLGLQNYLGFFQDGYYLKTFGNTLFLSTLVLLTSTLFGIPLAYILARYRQYGKTIFTALILLPIVLPAYAGIFAFIIFFGKYGTVNLLLMDFGIIETPINFIYGIHGLVFIQALHMLPFIVLSLSAGFTNIDPAFEEAAEVEGASGFRRFITVTLPLCTPSYLAGAVIVFLWPFTDWLTPLILGQVDYLPSVAYINIAYHFTDMHRKYMGIVAVVISSIVCIALFLVARWWVERKKYTGLSKGTTSEGRVIEPGLLIKSGSYLYMIFIAALVLLIPIVLGLSAFSRRWVFEAFPTHWTLENFRVILLETPMLIKNSFVFSTIALVFGVLFGLPAAYIIVRTRVPGKNALDFVITLMLAFPGMAVGVSYLLAFWEGIPLATHWIIMPLALFARRLPYFLRMAHSSYLQLDVSLEEASEVSGVGKLRTFLSISLPLLLKGVLVGVVMFFIMAFQEISTAIFLYRGGWETLPIGIFLNWHRGMEFGIAAAMAFLMIVITFILLLIIARIGGGILKAAWGPGGS